MRTDNAGNVYITSLNCVFRLDTSGVLTRIAGTAIAGYSGDGGPASSARLNVPAGVAVDTAGNIFVADTGNGLVRRIAPGGIITTVAGTTGLGSSADGVSATTASLSLPGGIAVDGSGNLFIAEPLLNVIRKVAITGIVTTVAGDGTPGFAGDGGTATNAQLNNPSGIAVDRSGNLFIADTSNFRVRKVSADGIITTFAGTGTAGFSGDGGAATDAELNLPNALTFDSDGNLFIADGVRARKISANGIITTVAGSGVQGYAGDGGPAAAAQFAPLFGVAVDPAGNLFLADRLNNRVREVNTNAIVSTAAGGGTNAGFYGDGGPGASALLAGPYGIAPDGSGNLFIADTFNNRIREVSANGIITTVAGNGVSGYSGDSGLATSAGLLNPASVAVDGSGNLFIAGGNRVRKVQTNGVIATVAGTGNAGYSGDGGKATNAELNGIRKVVVDTSGNLFIADTGNNRIRKVTPDGLIATIAGNGVQGYSGDGGLAISAALLSPSGIAVDTSGNLFIADTLNQRIREVSANGIVNTIAGTGIAGFSGDGGQKRQSMRR